MIRKFLFNLVIIVLVVAIVLYFSLKDNFDEIIYHIANMSVWSVILGVLILILYRAIVGLCSYMVVDINKEKVSLFKMIQINLIIMFFHGITPFSGGGQPMEIYYLHSEGVGKTKATNIVLQNFILYQAALIIVSFLAVIYNNLTGLFPPDSFMRYLVTLGFVINFLVLLVSFLVSFGKRFNKFILNKGISFLGKIKIIKDVDKTKDRFNNFANNFYTNAMLLKEQKGKVCIVLFLNILGLLIYYSIPFVIAIGMGVTDLNFVSMLVATTYIMMIGSFVPIPGGTGGIEYGFIYFVGYLISGGVLTAIMLIWRFITYYFGMVLGALALIFYRKKEKE